MRRGEETTLQSKGDEVRKRRCKAKETRRGNEAAKQRRRGEEATLQSKRDEARKRRCRAKESRVSGCREAQSLEDLLEGVCTCCCISETETQHEISGAEQLSHETERKESRDFPAAGERVRQKLLGRETCNDPKQPPSVYKQ
ncbi:hypothetical protein KUCAC02_033512, partial [Chaenocephalus aceratus]